MLPTCRIRGRGPEKCPSKAATDIKWLTEGSKGSMNSALWKEGLRGLKKSASSYDHNCPFEGRRDIPYS